MIMMLIEHRHTLCVPSGSVITFRYFYDRKITTVDANKEFICRALSIGRKVGVRPTKLLRGEWTVDLWI